MPNHSYLALASASIFALATSAAFAQTADQTIDEVLVLSSPFKKPSDDIISETHVVSSDEIEKNSKGEYLKKSDNSKINIGPSESMSKSKKNVIDPESMIKEYGADAVRWFILSDSPPEKDVQWSNQGVNAAYKFLQKIYNL